MAKLKLTYFDFHGGRGEPARLALSIGGIAFEDDRVPPSDWASRKAQTPFGALPVLEVDGQVVAQSNAINRYVGKLADLYPSDLVAGCAVRRGHGGSRRHHKQNWSYPIPSRRAEEGSAQRTGRRSHSILSDPATAKARSTWRPLLLRRSPNGRGSKSLRMDPPPKIRCARSYAG